LVELVALVGFDLFPEFFLSLLDEVVADTKVSHGVDDIEILEEGI
jgi:hypothetical protein